ncbi:Zyxin (Zyxin-2) (plasmid) [Pantoea sp. At-9b]|nr:Zyxin (Zyxin-2) [Pantoea sp. At-9b]
MAKVGGCNRLSPVRSPGALRPVMPPRRSVVSGVFLLISRSCSLFRCAPRGGLFVAPFSVCPEGYASPFLARSHSLCSLALRPPVTPFVHPSPVATLPFAARNSPKQG